MPCGNVPGFDYSVEEYKKSLISLFNDRKDADSTIECDGITQKVHSFVLWPRSSYFRSVCKGKFQEANLMHIELKEEDPVLVYRMIRYCYMLTWLDNHVPASLGVGHDTWISTLDTIVKMYAIGDEYDIQGLKQAAVERFGRCLQDSRASSSENLEFLLAVHLIYTTTPDNDRGLRDPAAKYGSNIWEWLWHLPDFRDYLSTYEDFVYDIVTRRGSSDASSE